MLPVHTTAIKINLLNGCIARGNWCTAVGFQLYDVAFTTTEEDYVIHQITDLREYAE